MRLGFNFLKTCKHREVQKVPVIFWPNCACAWKNPKLRPETDAYTEHVEPARSVRKGRYEDAKRLCSSTYCVTPLSVVRKICVGYFTARILQIPSSLSQINCCLYCNISKAMIIFTKFGMFYKTFGTLLKPIMKNTLAEDTWTWMKLWLSNFQAKARIMVRIK